MRKSFLDGNFHRNRDIVLRKTNLFVRFFPPPFFFFWLAFFSLPCFVFFPGFGDALTEGGGDVQSAHERMLVERVVQKSDRSCDERETRIETTHDTFMAQSDEFEAMQPRPEPPDACVQRETKRERREKRRRKEAEFAERRKSSRAPDMLIVTRS